MHERDDLTVFWYIFNRQKKSGYDYLKSNLLVFRSMPSNIAKYLRFPSEEGDFDSIIVFLSNIKKENYVGR